MTPGATQHGFDNLPCLLARVWADGRFELISPAWEALGYSAQELSGHAVCELVALEPDAAGAAVESLLTEGHAREFGLRSRDGGEATYHWNCHFDDYSTSMFVIGERKGAQREQE